MCLCDGTSSSLVWEHKGPEELIAGNGGSVYYLDSDGNLQPWCCSHSSGLYQV